MDNKKNILWRVYLMYGFMVMFSLAVILQLFKVQFADGEMWRNKAETLTIKEQVIEAARGNIYDCENKLLATSLPIYEVRMDLNAEGITSKIFSRNIDSLSIKLSGLFNDKSSKEFKNDLTRARKNRERYYLLRRNVRYTELKQLKQFPIFKLGKYKGGIIAIQQNKRERPFHNLAVRTIGYERGGNKPVGIEGAYNNYLTGINGKRLVQKISGNEWMPIENDAEIEPQDGADIITTIDVRLQDVAQAALSRELTKNKAHHGCVVLMEVKTGAIKAIANLSRVDSNLYVEDYNYAIGEATEPGSTFKLASLMAGFEDKKFDLNDSVNLEGGKKLVYGQWIKDSHPPKVNVITAQNAFETSSNVGVAKLIMRGYEKQPKQFFTRLRDMYLNNSLNIELKGEAKPRIKMPGDKDFSNPTLAWTAWGYDGVQQTALDVLTFYNAVANNGTMVRPQFVREVIRRGKMLKEFKPIILKEHICSDETIRKAKIMLEGVVQNGTGQSLKNPYYKIAGKTGTAQIAMAGGGYGNKSNGKGKTVYQASFVGYFPADKPEYSCIVVVNQPSAGEYYAAKVAGPIFKEIADKVYSTSLKIHKNLDKDSLGSLDNHPIVKGGLIDDANTIGAYFKLPAKNYPNRYITTNKTQVAYEDAYGTKAPNVLGMCAKDALFLLENRGFNVKVKGKGVVNKQSVVPGSLIFKGKDITIDLS